MAVGPHAGYGRRWRRRRLWGVRGLGRLSLSRTAVGLEANLRDCAGLLEWRDLVRGNERCLRRRERRSRRRAGQLSQCGELALLRMEGQDGRRCDEDEDDGERFDARQSSSRNVHREPPSGEVSMFMANCIPYGRLENRPTHGILRARRPCFLLLGARRYLQKVQVCPAYAGRLASSRWRSRSCRSSARPVGPARPRTARRHTRCTNATR